MLIRLPVLAIIAATSLLAAQHESMPPGMSHEEHMKQMNQRGNAAMGFDQQKVGHHFHLTPDGGSIEVSVNRTADDVSRQQIREHLKTIAADFAKGVFDAPVATHAEMPPGAKGMRERRARITYAYEETSGGGRVVITTKDRIARGSVHAFLRYQIREHATGDPLSIQKPSV
jgi:hypothetical protein